MISKQVPYQDHGASMFNGEQVNYHIEQDDHTDSVVEYDGTNTLIHGSFNVRMDDDGGDDNENIDDFDDVHDIPLLDKAYEPLYEGSKINLLSIVLLINELECYEWYFKCCNHTDAKVCKIIHHIYRIVINFICIPLIIVLLTHYWSSYR